MLRNIGIRSKILAVLALPVLVLMVAATVISVQAATEARRAVQVQQIAGQASGLTQLIRGLQTERALTMSAMAGDPAAEAQLQEVRAQVRVGITQVRNGVGSVEIDLLEDSAARAIQASREAHDDVLLLRRQIDSGALTPELVYARYTELIAEDIAVAERVANGVDDISLADQMRAYTRMEEMIELLAQERDMMAPYVAAGRLTPEGRAQAAELVAQHEVIRSQVIDQSVAFGLHVPVTGYGVDLARRQTVYYEQDALDKITRDGWVKSMNTEITALTQVGNDMAQGAMERATTLVEDAQAQAWQLGVVAGLLVVIPMALALLIARGITRPLRRLTDAASEIREQLPTMVERMQTPGEGPELTVPQIPVTTNDEIGRLAAAFNDVNSTTVQVAQEQAALRGSIAAMFVNVARRDQVLLSRQLAFIDQLEQVEENPDKLEDLFRLDHLATRMRRNAESLLVLAGIDTGRRLRRPMPLSDVVRTATSEIEHYDRVDLVLQADPPMVGHVALITAHMLAEVLENATNFSDPGSRVVVSTTPNRRGISVTVTDEGLGMTPEEIAEANERIAQPPISEVVGAQRLGFFVVGRLAKRLEATVSLRAGRSRGTIVTIDLPASLFVPGSVAELPAADASEQTGDLPALTDAKEQTSGEEQPAARAGGENGLPRRGSGPVTAPVPIAPIAAEPPLAPPMVVPSGDPSDVLPRRQRAEAPQAPEGLEPVATEGALETPVADEPVVEDFEGVQDAPAADESQEEAAPRRSGLFTSFRARRPGDADAAPSVQQPAREGDESAQDLDDLQEEESGVAQLVEGSEPSEYTEHWEQAPVGLEPLAELPARTPVQLEPDPEPVAAAPEQQRSWSAEEWEQQPYSPASLPNQDHESERIDAQHVEPQHVDAPRADEVAAAELTALASAPETFTAPSSEPAWQPEPVAQAPAPTPEPEPHVAAAALDILPSRASVRKGAKPKGRGVFGRRRSEAGNVEPMTRRELRGLGYEAPAPAIGGPVVPASFTAPPAPPAPEPVPSSLFGSAPTGEQAPAETFEPAPSAEAPEPASSPRFAIPAQSGRGPQAPSPEPLGEPIPLPVRDEQPVAPAPEPEPVPVPVADGMSDILRQRSALASEALTELSRLSAYSPAAVENKPPATLTRRTPAATPAAQVAPQRQTQSSRRSRNAADVRSMLSGFQAGVARGRTSPTDSTSDSASPTGGQP